MALIDLLLNALDPTKQTTPPYVPGPAQPASAFATAPFPVNPNPAPPPLSKDQLQPVVTTNRKRTWQQTLPDEPLNKEGQRLQGLLQGMGAFDMAGRGEVINHGTPNQSVKAQEAGFLSQLGRGALDYLSDPINRKQLAIGFNAMRLNPDANLARSLQSQIETEQAKRLLNQQSNQTVDFLKRAGVSDDLLDQARNNPELLKTLTAAHIKDMYTSPEDRFVTMTGEQLNDIYGSNVPKGKLYKMNTSTYEVIGIDGTDAPEFETAATKEYMYAKEQGYTGSFVDWKQLTSNGAKPLSATAANATGFYNRMLKAHSTLLGNDSEGLSLENQGTGQFGATFGDLPGGNYLVSEDYQLYAQAKRDFINATLRQESGAAIAESEFDSANRQYFPMPGDSPAVIEQKRRNRETAIQSFMLAGGEGPARLSINAVAMGNFVIMPDGRSVGFGSAEEAQSAAERINKGS